MNDGGKGVADDASLIDIFANAVGVVLILIVVGMLARTGSPGNGAKEQGTSSVVMSRRIATTVSQQRIPARSAALHDYVACDRRRAGDPSIMPILTLRQEYVQIEATGERLNRAALLRDKNALDTYLLSLSEKQRSNFRCDIYAIDLYYLALSILIEHNILTPRDFHFISSSEEELAPMTPSGSVAAVLATPAVIDPPSGQTNESADSLRGLPLNVTLMTSDDPSELAAELNRELNRDAAPPAVTRNIDSIRSRSTAGRSHQTATTHENEANEPSQSQVANGPRQNWPTSTNRAKTVRADPSDAKRLSDRIGPEENGRKTTTPSGSTFKEPIEGELKSDRFSPGVPTPPVPLFIDTTANDSVVLGDGGAGGARFFRTYESGLFYGSQLAPELELRTRGNARYQVIDGVARGADTVQQLGFELTLPLLFPSLAASSTDTPSLFVPRQLQTFHPLQPRVVSEARKKFAQLQRSLSSDPGGTARVNQYPPVSWKSSGADLPFVRIPVGVPVRELIIDSGLRGNQTITGPTSLVLRPAPFPLPGLRVTLKRDGILKVERQPTARDANWTRVSYLDPVSGLRSEGFLWTKVEDGAIVVQTAANEVTIDGRSIPQRPVRTTQVGWLVLYSSACVLVLWFLAWHRS